MRRAEFAEHVDCLRSSSSYDCRQTCWTTGRDRRWCQGNLMNFRLFTVRDASVRKLRVPDRRDVMPVGTAVVYVPCALYRSAGSACLDRTAVLPACNGCSQSGASGRPG